MERVLAVSLCLLGVLLAVGGWGGVALTSSPVAAAIGAIGLLTAALGAAVHQAQPPFRSASE